MIFSNSPDMFIVVACCIASTNLSLSPRISAVRSVAKALNKISLSPLCRSKTPMTLSTILLWFKDLSLSCPIKFNNESNRELDVPSISTLFFCSVTMLCISATKSGNPNCFSTPGLDSGSVPTIAVNFFDRLEISFVEFRTNFSSHEFNSLRSDCQSCRFMKIDWSLHRAISVVCWVCKVRASLSSVTRLSTSPTCFVTFSDKGSVTGVQGADGRGVPGLEIL